MTFRLRALLFWLFGLLALPALSACETAPGTGRTIFTGGMGPETEARLGYQEHQKIVPQFGGAYADPAIDAYLTGIGDLLARTSEIPDQKFTFTVLDTPMVNAFALPGGYVYITRGLLALADNEAEVAGVLAHEIGHVTARHAAERYGQTMAANILGLGLGILLGSGPATDLYGAVAGVALRSYSREPEYESDLLGVRYMSRAGYDPGAMATFLTRLLAHGRLEAELRGQPGKADAFDIMQTHPRTAERIARAIAEAGTKTVAEPLIAREIYLGKIDGLLYGDDPEQGFVRGRRFLHPWLRFAFEVPRGFRPPDPRERPLEDFDVRGGRFVGPALEVFDVIELFGFFGDGSTPAIVDADTEEIEIFLSGESKTRQQILNITDIVVNGEPLDRETLAAGLVSVEAGDVEKAARTLHDAFELAETGG